MLQFFVESESRTNLLARREVRKEALGAAGYEYRLARLSLRAGRTKIV